MREKDYLVHVFGELQFKISSRFGLVSGKDSGPWNHL